MKRDRDRDKDRDTDTDTDTGMDTDWKRMGEREKERDGFCLFFDGDSQERRAKKFGFRQCKYSACHKNI